MKSKINKKVGISILAGLLIFTSSLYSISANVEDNQRSANETEILDETTLDETNSEAFEESEVIEETEKQDAVEDVATEEETQVIDKEPVVVEDTENNVVVAYEPETTVAKATIIDSQETLQAALNDANGDAVIEIEGGTTITLNSSLSLKTTAIKSLKIKSTNDQEVKIINKDQERHISVTGTNPVNLEFENVIISGDLNQNLTNGGIQINNNLQGNYIGGFVAKENKIKSSQKGIIQYNGTAGSLKVSNAHFENNAITERFAVESTFLFVDTTNATFTLENSTFIDNHTENQSGGMIGIYNDNGSVIFDNVTVKDNTAMSSSAGMKYLGYKNSKVEIKNSNFLNNHNGQGTAGALYIKLRGASDATISSTNFEDNYGNRGGGAIEAALENTGTFLIEDTNFINNKAGLIDYDPETGVSTGLPSIGGAMNVEQFSGTSNLHLNNTTFDGNNAVSAGAFSIYNDHSGFTYTLIENSSFTNNTSDYHSGALDFNFNHDDNIDGLYTIRNTEIRNNSVSGKDNGPSYYVGGYGGAIYAADVINYPDILLLDNVEFSGNKSVNPTIWNLTQAGTTDLEVSYRKNVINTTFSDSSLEFIDSYSNVYNGDDVYIGNTGIIYFNANPDEIEDLVVNNYADGWIYSRSFTDTLVEKPIEPTSDKYIFSGWYDENDVKWDFDTMIQTKVHHYLYAKWELAPKKYTVTFETGKGSTVAPLLDVIAGSKITLPTTPILDNYKFIAWYKDGAHTELWDFENDTVNENVTLYARWVKNDEPIQTVSISYADGTDSGSIFATQTTVVNLGDKTPGFVGTPTREGYTFKGWSPEVQDLATESIIYVAQWIKDITDPTVPTEPTDPTKPSPTLPSTGMGQNYMGMELLILGMTVVVVSKLKRRED